MGSKVGTARTDTDADEGLVRQLGGWSAGAILVGAIIGSGIFRVPSVVAAGTGGVAPLSSCGGWEL